MSAAAPVKDLVVLAADLDIEFSLRGLLARPRALGIRPIQPEFYRHVYRDPGCRTGAHDFLRAMAGSYRHALVVFDRQGCGDERLSRSEIESQVESSLSRNGWQDRATAVVIDPELEQWVWSSCRELAKILSWKGGANNLREWLVEGGFCTDKSHQPGTPKEALVAALRFVQKPRSAALFQQLATVTAVHNCREPAFAKLKATLQRWFPPT